MERIKFTVSGGPMDGFKPTLPSNLVEWQGAAHTDEGQAFHVRQGDLLVFVDYRPHRAPDPSKGLY